VTKNPARFIRNCTNCIDRRRICADYRHEDSKAQRAHKENQISKIKNKNDRSTIKNEKRRIIGKKDFLRYSRKQSWISENKLISGKAAAKKDGGMVDQDIIKVIRKYLAGLEQFGIHARRGVLFGSFARGQADRWSDIDLVVIAPEFDHGQDLDLVKALWRATDKNDDRIEPIPCGEKEWDADHGRPILEMARKEGVIIAA
jgi:uncharacterized protein